MSVMSAAYVCVNSLVVVVGSMWPHHMGKSYSCVSMGATSSESLRKLFLKLPSHVKASSLVKPYLMSGCVMGFYKCKIHLTWKNVHTYLWTGRPGNTCTAAAKIPECGGEGREENSSSRETVVSAATCAVYTHTHIHTRCTETVICPLILPGSDICRMCSGLLAWYIVKMFPPSSTGNFSR